jgi:hypothetical protein
MVFLPPAEWSLYPEIKDDADTEEKGEALLQRDGLHGTPLRQDTACSSMMSPM